MSNQKRVVEFKTSQNSTFVVLLVDLFVNEFIGEEGPACTMVVRTLHWTVPHYSIWGLPFYLFYSTRFSQFLHQTPNQGSLRTLLCHLLSPAVCRRIYLTYTITIHYTSNDLFSFLL